MQEIVIKTWIWFFGFFVSIAVGHFLVKNLNLILKVYIGEEPKIFKLTYSLGCIERIIYTFGYIVGQYNIVWGWFAIKIANRLLIKKDVKNNVGEKANIYLISNLASLFFGVLGGWIIRFLQDGILLPFPKR